MKQLGTFGKRFRAARLALGLSQDLLADRLGITKAAVSQWELENKAPRFELWPIIRRELGADLDYLICGDNSKTNQDGSMSSQNSIETRTTDLPEAEKVKAPILELQTALITLAGVVAHTLPNIGVEVLSLLRDPEAKLPVDQGYLREFVATLERVLHLPEHQRRTVPDDQKKAA